MGLFLPLSQWQGSNSGTDRMEASDAKLPTMHMTVLHKIPTAHSGLTIVVVTSRWLPVAFPLVTVPNHFCSSQKHSVTALSSYSCFLILHSTKTYSNSFPLPFILLSLSPPCSPSRPLRKRNLSSPCQGSQQLHPSPRPTPSPTLSLASLMPCQAFPHLRKVLEFSCPKDQIKAKVELLNLLLTPSN